MAISLNKLSNIVAANSGLLDFFFFKFDLIQSDNSLTTSSIAVLNLALIYNIYNSYLAEVLANFFALWP